MPSAHELSARLADLLRNERTALAEFLVALADFDRKRLWADLDHASLFSFLTRDLGLSAGAAYYRKTAAEVLQKFPEVIEPLRDGRLCFTSIVELAKNLTPENRDEILPRFFHVSKRQAKAITAELQPAQVVPRREVVSRALAAPTAPMAEAALPLAAPLHPGEVVRANSEPAPQEGPPRRQPPRRSVDPLTATESRLHLTVSRGFLDKVEQARAALSHSHPGASTDAIFEVGLDLIIERHARRRGLVKNPRKKQAPRQRSAPVSPSPAAARARARYVPAAIRRAIWTRDQGKCQWPTHDGGICGSTCRVELDHIEPFAKGGRILRPEDGRLLCKSHQDLSARQVYGDEVMDNYTKPRGPTCKEPIAGYGAARIPPGSGRHRVFAGEPDHAETVPPRGAASAGAAPSMPEPATASAPSQVPTQVRGSHPGDLPARARRRRSEGSSGQGTLAARPRVPQRSKAPRGAAAISAPGDVAWSIAAAARPFSAPTPRCRAAASPAHPHPAAPAPPAAGTPPAAARSTA